MLEKDLVEPCYNNKTFFSLQKSKRYRLKFFILLEPSNVFINKGKSTTGYVMLGDFGLLNYPGKLTGSPLYMPKEIEKFKGNVDLFAFALILIELFFEYGTLALNLVRHSRLCWSKDEQLIEILRKSVADSEEPMPDFFNVSFFVEVSKMPSQNLQVE